MIGTNDRARCDRLCIWSDIRPLEDTGRDRIRPGGELLIDIIACEGDEKRMITRR